MFTPVSLGCISSYGHASARYVRQPSHSYCHHTQWNLTVKCRHIFAVFTEEKSSVVWQKPHFDFYSLFLIPTVFQENTNNLSSQLLGNWTCVVGLQLFPIFSALLVLLECLYNYLGIYLPVLCKGHMTLGNIIHILFYIVTKFYQPISCIHCIQIAAKGRWATSS